MSILRWALPFGLILLCAISLRAQDDKPPEGTLPELEVTPPQLPPVEVAPPSDPFEDLRLRFPDLSDLGNGWLDGGRRTNRSLLEDPAHRSIIDLQSLQERAPVDMMQALEREVGVTVQRTQRGAAAPFIRGLTGQQVLILVDGIRLNNATFRSGPNQYFNTIDPGMVDHIEVIRGPQSVIYGPDALAGAINVVTRSAGNRFHYDYGGGQWINRFSSADLGYYSRLNVEGSTSSASIFAGGGYANFNNLDRGGSLGRQQQTGYSHYNGDVKLDYLLDDLNMITFAFQHFEQEDVARSDRFPSRLTIFDPQQRTLAYVRMQGAELPGLFDRYVLTASWHRQREGERDQRLATNNLDIGEFDTETLGLTLLMSSDLDRLGRITYGIDWYYDDVDSFKNRFAADSGAFVSTRTSKFPDDSLYEQFGAYLEWDVDLTSFLSGVGGIRYSNVDVQTTPVVGGTPVFLKTNFNELTASGALNFKLTDELHLVGSVAKGFRAPNIDDLAANNSNVQQSALDTPSVDLRPEKSLSYDVGIKHNGRRLRAQAYYFWMDIDDMIQRTPAGMMGADTLFSRTNRDSHINGFEASTEWLFENGWSTYANFSYYFGKDHVLQQPLSRIPATQGTIGLRWRDEGGTYLDFYSWLVRRQDKLNFQDVGDSRIPAGGTPGFVTLNLRAGTWLSDSQRVTLWLENLTDQPYRVHGSGVDGAGLSATLGYEWVR